MNMKRMFSVIGLLLLIGSVGFNLWTYRLEPTAKSDPNDNTFQFALVDRTNQILNFADKKCTGITKPFCTLSLLSDHWVPNWSEGYNLPFYYSHVPQILIVTSYRLLSPVMPHVTLFSYYHIITYLLLSLFPLSVYLALSIIGLAPVTAGFGALISTQISTDGLYGLDPSSFLWRGWGLTSQLYAILFLPLAVACAFRLFQKGRTSKINDYIWAILMLTAVTAGHLGLGIIAFMSIGILSISPTLYALMHARWGRKTWQALFASLKMALVVFGGVFLFLGYWILPVFLYGNYHNTSVWDPIWKFDSYGVLTVLTNFFNGSLFDFGRLPILTALVIAGLFAALRGGNLTEAPSGLRTHEHMGGEEDYGYFPFAVLFAAWLLLYFGTATWGHILYLIPGMSDFHLSRFIVGVQTAGIFLVAIALEKTLEKLTAIRPLLRYRVSVRLLGYLTFLVVFVTLLFPQTLRYAAYNDTILKRGNAAFDTKSADTSLLIATLSAYESARPGRVFAGRGGSWGKDFRIAETPMYMYLSTYGIPTVLWLPETWSPNADTEQYFRENVRDDYTLYNIRYVVTPSGIGDDNIQPFWKLLSSSATWRIYEVSTDGYIGSGIRPAIVSTTKLTYLNVVRLWIQSDDHKNGLYPELTFDTRYPKNTGLPNFRMTDETDFVVPDGSVHSLFEANPRYVSPTPQNTKRISVLSQTDDSDMVFTAKVSVPEGCGECLVILRQSYHPSWTAHIDGKPTPTFSVFPFFAAVKLETPGTHTVMFSYRPLPIKSLLLAVSLIVGAATLYFLVKNRA